jgi:hypothetical protein
VQEALTSGACEGELSYETLELLGDSILNFTGGAYMYLKHLSLDGENLHVGNHELISNKTFYNCAITSGLPRYVFAEIFNPKTWVPPGPFLEDPQQKGLVGTAKSTVKYINQNCLAFMPNFLGLKIFTATVKKLHSLYSFETLQSNSYLVGGSKFDKSNIFQNGWLRGDGAAGGSSTRQEDTGRCCRGLGRHIPPARGLGFGTESNSMAWSTNSFPFQSSRGCSCQSCQ